MLATLSGRIHPLGALGVSMATFIAFFPFVQPWYLLWAVIPLAAWATRPWFRLLTILISALIAVVALPTGANTGAVFIASGVLAGVIVVGVLTAIFFENVGIPRRFARSGPSRPGRLLSRTRHEE
jgi:alpha-1,6-mannosyltransferase